VDCFVAIAPRSDEFDQQNCPNLEPARGPSCCDAYSRLWHEADMLKYLGDVRCWVNSGKHLLSLSFSGFDPTATWAIA
jgi:hypothetical protein